MGKRFWWWWSK